MTVTLNLETEEATVLTARAAAQGVDVETILHRMVAQLSRNQAMEPELTQKQQAALALLDSWTAEKEQLLPDELTANDVEFEQYKTNVNCWRAEEGRNPAFR